MPHISADNQAIYWAKILIAKPVSALKTSKKILSKLKTLNVVAIVEFEIATDIKIAVLVACVNCPYKPSSSSLLNLGPSTNKKVFNTVSFNRHC